MRKFLLVALILLSLPLFPFLNVVEVYTDSFFHFLVLSVQVTIIVLAFLGILGKKVEEIILGVLAGFWIGCISFTEVYEKLNYLFQLKNSLYQIGDELFSSGKFVFYSPGELKMETLPSFWDKLNNFSLFNLNFWLVLICVFLITGITRKLELRKGLVGGIAGLVIIGMIGWIGKSWKVNFNRIPLNNLGFYLYGETKPREYFLWLHFHKEEVPVEIKLAAVSKALVNNAWDANFFLEDPDIKKFGSLAQKALKLKIKLLNTNFSYQFLDEKIEVMKNVIKGSEYFTLSSLERISLNSLQSYTKMVNSSRENFLKAFLQYSSGNFYSYQALDGK